MTASLCRLDNQWTPDGDENGQLELTLTNLGGAALSGFRLVYTALTRNLDRSMVRNATLVRRNANYHEYEPPQGLVLQPGESWTFVVRALTRKPSHITDGVSTAYLILSDGTSHDIETGDLMLKGHVAKRPPVLVPEGRLEEPVGIIPWPGVTDLDGFGEAPIALFPAPGSPVQAIAAMNEVGALARRLFPNAISVFALTGVAGGLSVQFSTSDDLPSEGYRLDFAEDGVRLASGGAAGLSYALTTLAQMHHAAYAQPETFRFPKSGLISDAPRYEWRGCHLDVSRQVYSLQSVRRFIDILAWNKMNVLHWHLSDDEGWRLEIKALPELTRTGARRGPGEKMTAQLGSGARPSEGFYTQDEVRELIQDAARLHVGIMPEFDIPGHCTAVLAAYPHLIDPEESVGNYHSVQGYENNALNPAMDETYDLLEKVFREVADLFPFPFIHVGGDEVADGSWLGSPKARELMKSRHLSGTPELQAHLLKKVQAILSGFGKKLAGWDEVSHGGGVEPDGALLMAWQKPEIGLDLARMGYDVVMTPGQAYYLDMAQAHEWLEPGLTWAGVVPPQHCYEYEAAGDFPAELADRLKGVQGCIWSENLVSRQRFNHMVFPRLGAIAEAAWTPMPRKNWQRFCAQSRLMPEL
ncbi:MAG TPA: family 20 glycosylhydrolase [Devosiaceae bacterium]